MSKWSELPVWRKLCAVALILGSVIVIFRMSTRELASATVILELPRTGAAIRTLRIELLDTSGEEQLLSFESHPPAGSSEVSFSHNGEPGTFHLRARLERDGEVSIVDRTVVMTDGATIRVNLSDAQRL